MSERIREHAGTRPGAVARQVAHEPVTLAQIVAAVPGATLEPPDSGDVVVVGVRQDSRALEPGELFVVIRGRTSDGATFVPAARAGGAVALLVERGRGLARPELPLVEVDDVRLAMARAAALVHGEPTRSLEVLGVTGTNGKTTVTHLVAACLHAVGKRPGVLGTLGYRLAMLDEASQTPPSWSGHTSPEADELQRIAAYLGAHGATHLVMEVSSIALAADRVAGVRFAVAAFTNLTQDHLDYHGSMAAYAAAKDRLFFELDPARAVVNVDDAHGAELAARLRGAGRPLLAVSLRAVSLAEVAAERVESTAQGIQVSFRTPEGSVEIVSRLVGLHNAENLAVALGCALALGVPAADAARALSSAGPVAGRLERCDVAETDDVVAVVDYAHTPDALDRVLASLRPLCEGRLWCVFGCGGDRDPVKRGPMGEAVARRADRAIVTNDNPRGEDPVCIAEAVCAGLERAGAARGLHGSAPAARYEVELDRARAIELAVAGASTGDVVLVAGKGHESYQLVGGVSTPFDDRVELRRALALRRGRGV